jgi:circadian clock protein KaiB
MKEYQIKLYISGQTIQSRSAIKNLRNICETELADQCVMDIIDVVERPELAEDEKILATPTLIKVQPHPIRRIIGDLTDKAKVLEGLDIEPTASSIEGETS